MNASTPAIWTIIIALGIGTYLIRFSFLGLIGDRPMPKWFERSLRYVGVGILPGLIAPLVLWPDATGGQPDLARIMAALVALGIGLRTHSVLGSIIGGFVTLYAMIYFLG